MACHITVSPTIPSCRLQSPGVSDAFNPPSATRPLRRNEAATATATEVSFRPFEKKAYGTGKISPTVSKENDITVILYFFSFRRIEKRTTPLCIIGRKKQKFSKEYVYIFYAYVWHGPNTECWLKKKNHRAWKKNKIRAFYLSRGTPGLSRLWVRSKTEKQRVWSLRYRNTLFTPIFNAKKNSNSGSVVRDNKGSQRTYLPRNMTRFCRSHRHRGLESNPA